MILTVFAMVLFFSLIACDDADISKKQSSNEEMSKKISIPVAQKKISEPTPGKAPESQKSEQKDSAPVLVDTPPEPADDHYNSSGKIDPFIPLIQEKSESPASVIDDRPKRILTPLEKIDLSQIKLVAIISMKNRKIAMVEEANGKGYEVGIGTYIGKNQGRIFEITDSSIVVKEVTRDFKGQLKENVQEIKIHKNDSEE
ncbi:MAG: pilus assembly protein PilP [Proteobacteria bacterium]|nr:pilus assembly protein PilP [Pseudomonadota bacterium]